jgi:hypothetical protein
MNVTANTTGSRTNSSTGLINVVWAKTFMLGTESGLSNVSLE